MDSYADVCKLWPTDEDLAKDTGASVWAVEKWRLRDKIPPGWWAAVSTAAIARGFAMVTLEMLADIAAKKRAAA